MSTLQAKSFKNDCAKFEETVHDYDDLLQGAKALGKWVGKHTINH